VEKARKGTWSMRQGKKIEEESRSSVFLAIGIRERMLITKAFTPRGRPKRGREVRRTQGIVYVSGTQGREAPTTPTTMTKTAGRVLRHSQSKRAKAGEDADRRLFLGTWKGVKGGDAMVFKRKRTQELTENLFYTIWIQCRGSGHSQLY